MPHCFLQGPYSSQKFSILKVIYPTLKIQECLLNEAWVNNHTRMWLTVLQTWLYLLLKTFSILRCLHVRRLCATAETYAEINWRRISVCSWFEGDSAWKDWIKSEHMYQENWCSDCDSEWVSSRYKPRVLRLWQPAQATMLKKKKSLSQLMCWRKLGYLRTYFGGLVFITLVLNSVMVFLCMPYCDELRKNRQLFMQLIGWIHVKLKSH